MRYKFRPTFGIRTVLLSQRLWKSLSELILMRQVWQKVTLTSKQERTFSTDLHRRG